VRTSAEAVEKKLVEQDKVGTCSLLCIAHKCTRVSSITSSCINCFSEGNERM
jgi:hypothetical protein